MKKQTIVSTTAAIIKAAIVLGAASIALAALVSCKRPPATGSGAGSGAERDAGSGAGSGAGNRTQAIAVFIPGVRAGSAIYDMLAQGVEKAVSSYTGGASLNIIEGGYNQAEWEDKVTTLAASGKYDVIISSNPSLPAIVAAALEKFPAQKFILFDGELGGNPSVYSLRYNQREQGYLSGYIAALVSEKQRQGGGGYQKNRPRRRSGISRHERYYPSRLPRRGTGRRPRLHRRFPCRRKLV